jgi:hypothetical protein
VESGVGVEVTWARALGVAAGVSVDVLWAIKVDAGTGLSAVGGGDGTLFGDLQPASTLRAINAAIVGFME